MNNAAHILDQALNIGGGIRRRVRLSDLRAALPQIERATLDAELLTLQTEGTLVLFPIDDPADLTPADKAAALYIGTGARHILYLDR